MNHLPGSSPRSPAPSPDPDVDDGSSKKQATRVFKKSSSNGKITVYLGKRDFVDHITHVDPIDGVVLIDPDYVKDRKVFGHVLAAFRYGREDLDVLGLTFRKDLYLASEQVRKSIFFSPTTCTHTSNMSLQATTVSFSHLKYTGNPLEIHHHTVGSFMFRRRRRKNYNR